MQSIDSFESELTQIDPLLNNLQMAINQNDSASIANAYQSLSLQSQELARVLDETMAPIRSMQYSAIQNLANADSMLDTVRVLYQSSENYFSQLLLYTMNYLALPSDSAGNMVVNSINNFQSTIVSSLQSFSAVSAILIGQQSLPVLFCAVNTDARYSSSGLSF